MPALKPIMTPSIKTAEKHKSPVFILVLFLLAVAFYLSLVVGKYPLTLVGLIKDDGIQRSVFLNLRLSRTLTAIIGGFTLGLCGYVFQTVFQNPLASPDMIGVSSGASVGAAVGIVLLGSSWVTPAAFSGALLTMMLTLGIAAQDQTHNRSTVILCGVAIHALAQTALVFLKTVCDPEKQLPAIEYWIMGTLSSVSLSSSVRTMLICIPCNILLMMLFRHIQLLSLHEDEAKSLGMNVRVLRLLVLSTASLAISAVISTTGLISFLALISPHIAKRLLHKQSRSTFFMSGLVGALLLCFSDILARLGVQGELPVSLFTSLLGCPILIGYAVRRRREL